VSSKNPRNKNLKVCRVCHGDGKLTWIETIFGKKDEFKPTWVYSKTKKITIRQKRKTKWIVTTVHDPNLLNTAVGEDLEMLKDIYGCGEN
jgi:hypothetical protein